jgi:hypothetical protein
LARRVGVSSSGSGVRRSCAAAKIDFFSRMRNLFCRFAANLYLYSMMLRLTTPLFAGLPFSHTLIADFAIERL